MYGSRSILLALSISLTASASVVRIDVLDRAEVLGGKPIGSVGAYERVTGKVYFAVDPKLPVNRSIADIELAPRNHHGKVEFSADFYILRPVDPAKGNGTALFEVSNRGGRGLISTFDRALAPGDPNSKGVFEDGFLLTQGFTLVWLGWQFDLQNDPKLLRLYAPVPTEGGRPIKGPVRSEYVPNRRVLSFSLGDRTMVPYPVLNLNDRSIQLTVRYSATGRRKVIPRNRWQFARDKDGKPVPDRTHVFMSSGFEPGKIYEVVYTAQNPVLSGAGMAGIRDFISFLKHGAPEAEDFPLGSERQRVARAVGFGVSQSGRFLRSFLYYGFNQDERGRRVFDGLWAHVAGAGRGSFNHRFAQPSRDGQPFMNFFYPTDAFPFSDLEQTDREMRLTEGLLSRAENAHVVPKIFYSNSSYEYWGRAASLTHTTVDGKADFAPPQTTRIYMFAGSQHGPGSFPPKRDGRRYPANPVDFRWSMRALLVALNRWITDGAEPPPSQYPKIENGALIPPQLLRFPEIPGIQTPTRIHRAWRLNRGPEFRTKGIISIEPPKLGKPYPVLVPRVDEDGNETSGIRMPEVQVPLATMTGWNLRDPKLGAPQELFGLAGAWIPFPRTVEERVQFNDPRRSIEERYGNRANYLKKIEAAARVLVREGYLLGGDVPRVVAMSARQWDFLMKR
ncbi:MAG: alpha/beta hydrolase domain-containing protein [Bryobacteraceae bacterium]